jgi:hypothetical protein
MLNAIAGFLSACLFAPAVAGGFRASLTPLSGPAPLTVLMDAYAEPDPEMCYAICAYYDFGNDAIYGDCGYLYPCEPDFVSAVVWIDETYVLPCPGAYEVTAYVSEECAACPTFEWEVVVDPFPALGLAAICDPLDTECSIIAVGNVPMDYVIASIIDWGDGTSPQPFTWVEHDGWFEGPSHDFGRNGYFTVRVTNDIEGAGRSCSQTAVVTANPGYTTPINQATWGRIKALYRGN